MAIAKHRAHGGDPGRIVVAWHSSGAHLAAALLTTDWPASGGPQGLIKGSVIINSMFELYPVLLSARSSYVKISSQETAALSPMRHLDRIDCSVIVVSGERESPEFRRHAADFATALAGMGRLSKRFELAGRNHFEVPETLDDASSELSTATPAMLRI